MTLHPALDDVPARVKRFLMLALALCASGCSSLLESDGVRVLTDPVFGERASPVRFAGPKRFHAVPATLEELPALDLVLLSHDHYDHLDYRSVAALNGRNTTFVPAWR